MPNSPEEYIKECKELIKEWEARQKEFVNAFNLLALKDENKARGLESFVANDPRVIYQMALFLLTPQNIPYNIPISNETDVVQNAIEVVEGKITKQWNILDERNMKTAQGGSWLYSFNSMLLSTGWFAVFAIASGDEFIADIWHPATVFPEFGEDGLDRVVHTYKQSASGLRKKLSRVDPDLWQMAPKDIEGEASQDVYDYWDYNQDGQVCNCIVIGNKIAKYETFPELEEIPVIIGAVNGLPGRGELASELGMEEDWHALMGQSIVSPLKTVFKAYNRQNTFMQQILRDSAQPRIVERTRSKGVVNAQNWDKRGAIFHLDVDEDIHTLAMPGMPPEMTTSLQNMQGMIQRGGFDYSLFQGGQASGYAQALTSASAQQVLTTFKMARDFVISQVSNNWIRCIRTRLAEIPGWTFPIEFPHDAKFKAEIPISIPGDLIQRATTMRQLDPTAKLSHSTTLRLTMPEVTDPNNEIVMARVDTAMQNPIFANLDMVEALEESAEALEAEGRMRHAQRYRKYAGKLEQMIEPQNPEQDKNNQGPPGIQNAAQ